MPNLSFEVVSDCFKVFSQGHLAGHFAPIGKYIVVLGKHRVMVLLDKASPTAGVQPGHWSQRPILPRQSGTSLGREEPSRRHCHIILIRS